MSENRFWFVIDKGKLEYVQDNVAKEKITVSELEDLLNKLYEENEKLRFLIDINSVSERRKLERQVDEQQELIEELQVSDEMGWKRAEMFEKKCPKELHNKEMYIKRLEYKVQKSKEENEQLKQKIQLLEKENEDLREVNKENQLLHEENVKQCERWKNLYELKDSEVTARVNGLNKVCEYYLTEVQFKADTDPNEAVKEVINRILNTEME